MYVRPNFEDVSYADVVVIGRISNYRIVRDEAFRRRMLASPGLSADMRRMYEDPRQSLMTDYARFDGDPGRRGRSSSSTPACTSARVERPLGQLDLLGPDQTGRPEATT